MWRDLERTCRAMGVPLKRPEPFPQPSLLAARVALALEGKERSDFSRRVFVAEFGQGLPIGDRETLGALLEECGVEPVATFERAQGHANKARLKAECARATEIGIIGAPCLVTADGEVFWGNDRLEQGLDWAAARAARPDAARLSSCVAARSCGRIKWSRFLLRRRSERSERARQEAAP